LNNLAASRRIIIIHYMKRLLYILPLLLVLTACDTNNPDSPQKVKYLIETSEWVVGTDAQYRSKTVYERGKDAKYLLSYSTYTGDELKSTFPCKNEGNKEIRLSSAGDTIWTIVYYDKARTMVKEQHRSYLSEYSEYDKKHHDRLLSYKSYMDGTLHTECTYQYDDLMGYTEYYRGSDRRHVIRDTIWYTDNSYRLIAKRRVATLEDGNIEGLQVREIQCLDCEYGPQGISKQVQTLNYFETDGTCFVTSKEVVTYNWLDDLNVEYHAEMWNYIVADTIIGVDGYKKYTY